MSLFKKTNNAEIKPIEQTTYEEMLDNIYSVGQVLENKAENVYVAVEALKCYSEGDPDYMDEVSAIEKMRFSLKCTIGEYDGLMAECINYRTEHDTVLATYSIPTITSHERIRKGVRNALNR